MAEVKIMEGRVMHRRKGRGENEFSYDAFYVLFPISSLGGELSKYMKHNRWGVISFYDKDHEVKEGMGLEGWLREVLRLKGMDEGMAGSVVLVSMPRMWGYVFNPVSFWLCCDDDGGLRMVLCEVCNTYGEKHIYVCAHVDGGEIGKDDELVAEKMFHVSPFLAREGVYRFRFMYEECKFSAVVMYEDELGEKVLLTSLTGVLRDFEVFGLRGLWKSSVHVLRVGLLIHIHALVLWLKGIGFRGKPEQKEERISSSK